MPWTTELTPNSRAVRLRPIPPQPFSGGVKMRGCRCTSLGTTAPCCHYTCRICRACACPDARNPQAADPLRGAPPTRRPEVPRDCQVLLFGASTPQAQPSSTPVQSALALPLVDQRPRQRLTRPLQGLTGGLHLGRGTRPPEGTARPLQHLLRARCNACC